MCEGSKRFLDFVLNFIALHFWNIFKKLQKIWRIEIKDITPKSFFIFY